MLPVSQKRYLARATEEYAGQLHNRNAALHAGAIGYLREHAIDQDIAIRYELGFVAEPLPGDERFQGMLSIPYLSPSGVMALKFRSFSDSGGKYAKRAGSKNRLYNTAAYFQAGNVIGLTEGEMDSISATEHLSVPSMGVPGVEAWKDEWSSLFKDFTKVFIFADGDQPGKDFAHKMADTIGWRAQIVQCPDGEDVSSMVAGGQADELMGIIRTSNEDEAA